MTHAVTLLFDAASSARLVDVWRLLSARGISDSMIRLGYRPHLTLAVYDALDEVVAQRVLGELCDGLDAWAGRFIGVDSFATPGAVLWARPAADRRLARLQARLVSAIADPCHRHYLPENWVPHCTLADDLTAATLASARQLFADGELAMPLRYEAIELVRFPPVDVRASWSLAQ